MAEFAEKSEHPTTRKLEEAQQRGQIPRSAEVQTFFVLLAGTTALAFNAGEMWRSLVEVQHGVLGHLHEISLTFDSLQGHLLNGALFTGRIVAPVVGAILVGGLLAGGVQSRFQTAPQALEPTWERCNPLAGLKRIFSLESATPAGLALLKLAAIAGLSYGVIIDIAHDPIFFSAVHPARVAEFLASTSLKLIVRLLFVTIGGFSRGNSTWIRTRRSGELLLAEDVRK